MTILIKTLLVMTLLMTLIYETLHAFFVVRRIIYM
jgi:hypothetical protein